MKRIAIITWKFHNYGTVLQAFATNYFLNQFPDTQCDLIDYDLEKKNLDIPRVVTPVQIIRKVKNRLELDIERKRLDCITLKWKDAIEEREQRFENFIKKIPQTEKMNKAGLYRLNEDYSIFICGSDQIWNPKFFDGRYMLDFVQDIKIKIAFSPSFGTTKIPKTLEVLYKDKLSRLDAISVREDVGCDLIRELLHKEAYHLCDPTLLLSSEEWTKALQLVKCDGAYILCYFLSDNQWYKDMVYKVQKRLNLPIKVIGVKKLSYSINGADVIHPGPVEFVQYIANAEFVITDSFHGMLFSTIFDRQYIVLQRFSDKTDGEENSRLISFMKAAKLENRYYTTTEDIHKECFETLNAEQICFLRQFREESIEYLMRHVFF